MLTTFIHTLMSAVADAECGAGYGERSESRTNTGNGYRHRDFDTRAGTIDVGIPKLRNGSYFPDWLLERRRRAERALTTWSRPAVCSGVSTRRMEKLVACDQAASTTAATMGPTPEIASRSGRQARTIARIARSWASVSPAASGSAGPAPAGWSAW
ncbi:hypothetical protein GCM10010472_28700 [Pseudonocardia halophobica]|uniref:Mutator family transposase n=1 Tax=Pseudonocardia halophobica TaxID=29401 RepID=A0A9W6L145_9PSEU|nr:hypothetical protein GCM10017577_02690 [Pseudonocardia halophobica]